MKYECAVCGKPTDSYARITYKVPCCETCEYSPTNKLEKENAELRQRIEKAIETLRKFHQNPNEFMEYTTLDLVEQWLAILEGTKPEGK